MMQPLDSNWVNYGNKCVTLRLKLYPKIVMKLTGKPDAGKPHVRFDEGE